MFCLQHFFSANISSIYINFCVYDFDVGNAKHYCISSVFIQLYVVPHPHGDAYCPLYMSE